MNAMRGLSDPVRDELTARLETARSRFPVGSFVKLPDLRRFGVTGYSDDGLFLHVWEVRYGGSLQIPVGSATRYIPRASNLAEEEQPSRTVLFR